MTGYGIISKKVMLDENLSITAKSIYSLLASLAGNKKQCFPSVSFITHSLSITESTFYKHLNQLKKSGYISVAQSRENQKFGRSIYTLLDVQEPNSGDTSEEKNSDIAKSSSGQISEIEDKTSNRTQCPVRNKESQKCKNAAPIQSPIFSHTALSCADSERTQNYSNNINSYNINSFKITSLYKSPSISQGSVKKIDADTIDRIKKQIDYVELKDILQENDSKLLDIIVSFMVEMQTGLVKLGEFYQTPAALKPIVEKVTSDTILEFIEHLKGKDFRNVKNIRSYCRTCFYSFVSESILSIAAIPDFK